jgi:hypothetical protein
VAPAAPVLPLQIGVAPPSGRLISSPPAMHCALISGSVVVVSTLLVPLHSVVMPPSESCVTRMPPPGQG